MLCVNIRFFPETMNNTPQCGWSPHSTCSHDLFHNVNLRKVLFQSLPSHPSLFPSSLLWNKERKKIFLKLVSCLGYSLGNLTRFDWKSYLQETQDFKKKSLLSFALLELFPVQRYIKQRWANNSKFEYHSNTSGWILVFVFIFGWLFETEYHLYLYSYLGDFIKPNIICIGIWVIF